MSGERILIIHLAGFGDLVMGLPALAALRRAYPEAKLYLLTWKPHAALAERLKSVDGYFCLENAASPGAFLRNLAAIWRIRRQRVTLAVNLYQLYRPSGVRKLRFLLGLIRPRVTAGRNTDGRGKWLHVKVDESTDEPLHEAERQMRVAVALGGSVLPRPSGPWLHMLPGDAEKALSWLTKQEVEPDERLVLVHAGSGRAAHRWPAESFAQVARQLEESNGVRIVLIGNRSEKPLAQSIAGKLKRPIVATGELSLPALFWLMSRARLLLTNDSGPMHLASLLNVPLVAATGPSNPLRYGPYPLNRPGQVVFHAADCPECHRHDCRGHEALRRLPVEPVLNACQAILRGETPQGIQRVRSHLRVLHVHTLPVVSGSGINTFLTMRGQSRDGFNVELACADGGALIAQVEQAGMRVRKLRHMVWPLHPWHDPLAVLELARLIRREKYAIVHTHNSKAGFIGRLAARLARAPVVVHTVHGFSFHANESRGKQMFYRVLERVASGWCDMLIVISQPLIDWALAERIAPASKMVKIYSGIDVERFRAPVDVGQVRASLGLGKDDFVVGEVAKLWPGKGHGILLRAAAMLRGRAPNLKVLLVGDGELRSELERDVQALHLKERVVFAGFREDVPAITRSLDVAVLPSLFEGMGRAVIEAQAAGCAVIGTRVGGIPDLIRDGDNGLLIEPGSAEALATAIDRLYRNPDYRRQLGDAAARGVDERFSEETMVRETIAVYERLLRRRWSDER